MKHLTKILTFVMILFITGSCSEDFLQNENEDLNSLKCTYPCSDETAWAAGTRYLERGNWATFTKVPDILPEKVSLNAGQRIWAGWVWFIPIAGDPGHINIAIQFTQCVSLQNVSEAIKIQGYNTPPAGIRPVPGLFTTYKGNGIPMGGDVYVTVPIFKYYGIHLDVQNCCDPVQ